MASVEREKECCICCEIFVNPKILPCHHSYCERCIKTLVKGSKLQCPTCKSYCDVETIVNDFRTASFIKTLKDQEDDFNRRLVAYTVSNTEPSAPPEPIVTAQNKCELCGTNQISYWCVECEQWMCSSCKNIHFKAKYAKDHHIEQLSVKNKEIESSLLSEVLGLKTKIDQFHTYIKTLQTERKNTQATQFKTIKQAKELRDQCILEINVQFNRIEQDILKGLDEFSFHLDREVSKQQKIVLELEAKYQAYQAIIRKKDPKLAVYGNNLVEQAKNLVKKTNSPNEFVTGITIKLERLQKWSSNAVSLDILGGSIIPKVSN